jgi:hypothetical protein
MSARRALLGGLVGAAILGAGGFVGCGGDAPTAPSAPVPTRGDGERGDAAPAVDPFPSTPAPTGAEALADAQRLGTPLLVLLAPADEAARADRARVVEVFLQADMVRARTPLVLAHVVALGPADLESIAPGASASAPFAVLVETDGRGEALQVVPWPAALAGPDGLVSFDVARRDPTDDDARAPDRAFHDLVRALRNGIVGDTATQARRESQRVAAGHAARGADLRRAAAEILRRSEALPDAWRLHPIPGTRWVPRTPVDASYGGPDPAWCGTPGADGWRSRYGEPRLEDDQDDEGHVARFADRGPLRVRLRRPPTASAPPRVRPLDDGPPPNPATPKPLSPARLEFLPPAR